MSAPSNRYMGPAFSFHRTRAFQMGWKAAQRSGIDGRDAARARWERRHAGTPVLLCWQDWEDGYKARADIDALS